jgi:glutaredoxin 3
MNVEIYTKPDCPYCSRAKSLLRDQQIPFTEQKLDEDFTREILLEKFPEAKSFPVVVIDGFRIGGYTELRHKLMEETQDTRKLLNEGN